MLDFITKDGVQKMGSALDIGHYKHSFGSLVSGFELTNAKSGVRSLPWHLLPANDPGPL